MYKYSPRLEENLQALLAENMDSWIPTHHKNVYTINMNDSVYSAFYRIWEREVSGLAVVDDHGRLVANISASDIKVSDCRFSAFSNDFYREPDFIQLLDKWFKTFINRFELSLEFRLKELPSLRKRTTFQCMSLTEKLWDMYFNLLLNDTFTESLW